MTTFDTILGRCGIAWTDAGISRVYLPSPTLGTAEATSVPEFVAAATRRIAAMLTGAPDDLTDLPLDDARVDEFRRSVYAATRRVGPGATTTYGEIARAIGMPAAARDVGVALARNPTPIVVPCHRVIAANGALTGFSAPGGLTTKRRMLELEGAPGFGQRSLFG